MQAKVQKITGGEEKEKENASQEKNITQGAIKAAWQVIKKDFNAKKDKKDKGLESFEKALEAKPKDVVKILSEIDTTVQEYENDISFDIWKIANSSGIIVLRDFIINNKNNLSNKDSGEEELEKLPRWQVDFMQSLQQL